MPDFLSEKKGPILYMTLNRPEKLNAINANIRHDMAQALVELKDNPELRVGVFTGAGDRAFSTGGDLNDLSKLQSSLDAIDERFWQTYSKPPIPFREMGVVWKPLIAAVNGYCMGGGFELAIACDIIIASDNAVFAMQEGTLGAVPSAGGTQRLIRRVPLSVAAELLLTGKRIDAQEAYRIGLVNTVVPKEELQSIAEEMAAKIAGNPPHAMLALKELIWRGGFCMSLTEGLRMEKMFARILRGSSEQKERMSSSLKNEGKKT